MGIHWAAGSERNFEKATNVNTNKKRI